MKAEPAHVFVQRSTHPDRLRTRYSDTTNIPVCVDWPIKCRDDTEAKQFANDTLTIIVSPLVALAMNRYSHALRQEKVDISHMWWRMVFLEWERWVAQLAGFIENLTRKSVSSKRDKRMRLIPTVNEQISIVRLNDAEINEIEGNVPAVFRAVRKRHWQLCRVSRHSEREDVCEYV